MVLFLFAGDLHPAAILFPFPKCLAPGFHL
jgi:hypothetical protein